MSYAAENQNNERFPLHMEKWRLPYTFESALGKELKRYIMGILRELCESVKIEVVFLYEKDASEREKGAQLSENSIEIISDDYMEAKYAKDECKTLWGTRGRADCREQDKRAYKILFDYYYNGVDKDKEAIGELKLSDKKIKAKSEKEENHMQYFTYSCRINGKELEEWIIPIFVCGKFCGAFITGQFENKNKSFDEADFFTKIASIQDVINSFYNNANETHEQELRKRLTDMVWGKNSLYDQLPEIKSEDELTDNDIIQRLKASRSYLFDSVICMREIFDLEDITVYKPISDFRVVESAITVLGGNINRTDPKATVKRKGDWLTYDRDFAPSAHQLRCEIIANNHGIKSSASEQIITVVEEGEYCRQWLIGQIPQDFSGYFLCVYAMSGYPKYPVGYLFKLGNADEREIELKRHEIERCLERITSVFLAQWVMNYSAYYKLQYKTKSEDIERVTRELRHELGQSYMGFLANIKYFEENIDDLFHQSYYNPQRHKKLIRNIIKNARSFAQQSMERVDITRYMSGIPKPNKRFFYPYGEFLYKWSEIYQETMNLRKLKFNIVPRIKSGHGKYEDEARPKMYADLDMIEQITFNLTTNAMKYSVMGTTITLDARLNEDGTMYQIILSNYSFPMYDEDEYSKIFERNYQGSNVTGVVEKNAVYNKDSGGVGLAITRDIAEKHGGTLELKHEKISSLCVPLFQEYYIVRSGHFFELCMKAHGLSDEELLQEIKCEEKRLKENNLQVWNELNAMRIVSTNEKTIALPTIINSIKKGIVKYTFVLSIPHKNEREVKDYE